MDANVAAALISVGGSAAMAALGTAMQWLRKRKRSRTLGVVLSDLQQHPCLTLSQGRLGRINCCDPVKAELLNALREAVLLRPVEQALGSLLDGLQECERDVTAEQLEIAFGVASDYIHREQQAQLHSFPVECHDVAQRLLETHRNALVPASDLQAGADELHPLSLLEALFAVFYVATYSAAFHWAQTANQLNGQLNGVEWRGQKLQYTFQGNVSDASRILSHVLGGLQDILGQDCVVLILCPLGRIDSATISATALLGYAPQELVGKPLSGLQLGVHDLSPHAPHLAELESAGEGLQIQTRMRHANGDLLNVCAHADRIIFSAPMPRVCKLVVLLFRSKEPSADSQEPVHASATNGPCNSEREDRLVKDKSSDGHEYSDEDLHTRFALLVSALTHPTRRVMAGALYVDSQQPLVVCTVVDGAPDLPLLEVGKTLHTQLGIAPRRVADACSRCSRRVHPDLLRSSTLSYVWRGTCLAAEFYLLGSSTEHWAIFTIHRPSLHAAEAPTGASTSILTTQTRKTRPRKKASLTATCLPKCGRASASE